MDVERVKGKQRRKGQYDQAHNHRIVNSHIADRISPIVISGLLMDSSDQYLRWITDRTARAVAARTNGEFPVIARHDDAYGCDKVGNMSAGDSNDILYVFTYSETSRSLCFVTYQGARESATQSRSEVLSSNSGQNYGRQLSTPIAAVPVGLYLAKTLSVREINSLHSPSIP